MPVLYPPVATALAVAVQHALTRKRPVTRLSGFAGGGILSAGGVLGVSSLVNFLRFRTTTNPARADRTSHLVTSGANGVSRNPMYLALVGVPTSYAVARRCPIALVSVVALAVFLNNTYIVREEAALRSRFGEEYEAYVAKVPRWL